MTTWTSIDEKIIFETKPTMEITFYAWTKTLSLEQQSTGMMCKISLVFHFSQMPIVYNVTTHTNPINKTLCTNGLTIKHISHQMPTVKYAVAILMKISTIHFSQMITH